jgi:hypothetical protein
MVAPRGGPILAVSTTPNRDVVRESILASANTQSGAAAAQMESPPSVGCPTKCIRPYTRHDRAPATGHDSGQDLGLMLRSALQDVPPPRDPNEERRGTTYIGGEYPANRVRRDRLAKQRLNARMDMRDPHRPSMLGEDTNDRVTNPSRPPSPTPSTRDRSRWRFAGPQSSQLLGQMAQGRLDLLVR